MIDDFVTPCDVPVRSVSHLESSVSFGSPKREAPIMPPCCVGPPHRRTHGRISLVCAGNAAFKYNSGPKGLVHRDNQVCEYPPVRINSCAPAVSIEGQVSGRVDVQVDVQCSARGCVRRVRRSGVERRDQPSASVGRHAQSPPWLAVALLVPCLTMARYLWSPVFEKSCPV